MSANRGVLTWIIDLNKFPDGNVYFEMVGVFQARFKGKSALTGSYILQNSENGPVCPPPVQATQVPSVIQPSTANAYLGYFPSSSYGYGFAEQVREDDNVQ